MTKIEFMRMCYIGLESRRLIIEGLGITIHEQGQAIVGDIVLSSVQEVEALIRLVMDKGDDGFDRLDDHR